MESGNCLRKFCNANGSTGEIMGLSVEAMGVAGVMLATASDDGKIRLYELGQERLEPEAKKEAEHQEETQKLSEVTAPLLPGGAERCHSCVS